jgi:sensor histidine kinase YesM
MVYLRSFDLAIDAHNSSLYCANPVANSIINYYADMAKKENIKMTIEAMIPENIGIENIDLTCVLGNVLENAIEGCLRLPKEKETEIDVKIKYFDKRLRVRVENTCDQEIEFIGELPKTKKPGGGTGTRSIVYTAEIYDGTAGFTVIDNRFISQIVLNEK